MEKNYPLSPNDEPPKANITSAELITFQPLERNSVIYEDIPLPTALNVDEQGSPPLSCSVIVYLRIRIHWCCRVGQSSMR